jgi:hypothetical protein
MNDDDLLGGGFDTPV